MDKSPARHIELMDYLRGAAIICVLLFHTLGTAFGMWTLPWDGVVRDENVPISFLCFLPLSFGQIGVPIFFVVSGFCIHLSFQQSGGGFRNFFVRRFFRIYPPYLAALAFAILLLESTAVEGVPRPSILWPLLTHLLMVFNFDPSSLLAFNGVFWSLSIEVQLYLIYPVLLLLVGRLGWKRTMAILAICECVIRAINHPMENVGATVTPFGYWFSWSLGAFIADAVLKNEPLPFAKAPVMPWFFLMVLSYFFKPTYPFLFPLAAVTTAIITSRILSRTMPQIKLPAVSLTALKKIGIWSYSIYLLHEPLLRAYGFVISWILPDSYHAAPAILSLVVLAWIPVIVFGFLWHEIFELPSIALGRRLVQKTFSRFNAASFSVMAFALLLIAVANCWINFKFTPEPPQKNNNMAWSLATNPDPSKRNGALAVKLAEDASRRTQFRNATITATLAASYAEAGRFDDAVAAAQKAIEIGTENGEANLVEANRQLLVLYQKHQAYHEPAKASAAK